MSTPSTITDRLHARSDAKLRAFCATRFGDLFELCNGHHATPRPAPSKELINQAVSLGIKEPEKFPWHGAVWSHASEVLFLMLQTEWRDKEVADFMERVETVSAELEELRNDGGGQ